MAPVRTYLHMKAGGSRMPATHATVDGQYLPFGAGPRSCIGDHFAMLEATLALATIIRRIEIISLDDDFPLATPFTTVAAAPIQCPLAPPELTLATRRRPGPRAASAPACYSPNLTCLDVT